MKIMEHDMSNRFSLRALLFVGLLLPLASCSNGDPSLTSIVVSPSTETVTLAPPGSAQGSTQFTAIGYYTHPGHTATTRDITQEVTWASSDVQVANIVATGANAGFATATGWVNGGAWTGNTMITASAPGFHGDIVSNQATFIVTSSSSTDDVITLSVTPNPYTFTALNATNQFTATGTTLNGVQENLTTASGIAWTSGNTSDVTIGAGTGIATAVAAGSTTVTAKYSNADGTSVQGSATVNVP
jgi:hypothetical protein